MQFFVRQLIVTSLLGTLGLAEHIWPGDEAYYGYRGPTAPLSSDGRVMDTPEVAHARAAHLAMRAELIASMDRNSHHEVWEEPDDNAINYRKEPAGIRQQIYRGSFAPLGHDGRVIDTVEVAQARAAHLEAHARAAAKASPDYDYHESNDIWDDRGNQRIYVNDHPPVRVSHVHHYSPTLYRGPPAPLAPDGRVLDTPEVAKAKEAHLRAHAHATALTARRESNLYYKL